MSSYFFAVLGLIMLLYAAANYYTGLRFLQSLRAWADIPPVFWWGGYLLLCALPFASRVGKNFLPPGLDGLLSVMGGYWMAAVYYLFFLWGAADLLRLILSGSLPEIGQRLQPSPAVALIIVLSVASLLAYGTWNARNPVVRHFDISIGKEVPGLKQLRAVMVSDIHLGQVVGNDRLDAMVETVNRLEPDIVFLVGDTIDEDVRLFVERGMTGVLKKIRARHGVYAVMGNHEYIGGNSLLAVEYLSQAGVRVLRDEYVKVDGRFYVVGRDDRMAGRMLGRGRLDLDQVMAGIDLALPVILLDHQPSDLNEGARRGVDLQLSGHTHHGQFSPNQLVTRMTFEMDWGYLRKGAYQVIVSCGFGTWGPPIRIGNTPEIVDITIEFGKPE